MIWVKIIIKLHPSSIGCTDEGILEEPRFQYSKIDSWIIITASPVVEKWWTLCQPARTTPVSDHNTLHLHTNTEMVNAYIRVYRKIFKIRWVPFHIYVQDEFTMWGDNFKLGMYVYYQQITKNIWDLCNVNNR